MGDVTHCRKELILLRENHADDDHGGGPAAPRRGSIELAALLLSIGCVAAYYVGAHHQVVDEPASRQPSADAAPRPDALPVATETKPPASLLGAVVPATSSSSAPRTEPAPSAVSASAVRERDRRIQELRNSGPDRRNLITDVTAITNQWQEIARTHALDVEFAGLECHRIGCSFDAIQNDSGVADKLAESVTHTHEFTVWNGSKMRSGPIARLDGKVDVTWVISAPPEGEPVSLQDPALVAKRRAAIQAKAASPDAG
jgi:hypothetical protein